MTKTFRKKRNFSFVRFIRTYWIILGLFSLGFLVILYRSNSFNPFSIENTIDDQVTIDTSNYKGYKITQSTVKVGMGSTLPDTRNYEYYFDYSVQTQNKIPDGTANHKTLFMYSPLISFFQPLVVTNLKDVNNKYVIISNDTIFMKKIFNEEVTNILLELTKKETLKQGVLNVILLRDNTIHIRVFLLKTDDNLTEEEIISRYRLSVENQEKIYHLLTTMVNNAART